MPSTGLQRNGTNDWVSRIARLQPWYLLVRYPNRLARSLFAFTTIAIAIGIISVATICTGQPLLFPSLGPTAFLFFSQPTAPSSCPRNAILSHGSGILLGWFSYWLFSTTFPLEPSTAQVASATFSLGAISALMVAARIPHPPAASTTLIVSLGLMLQWQQFVAVMAGVILLTMECYVIHRISGIVYPVWSARPEQQQEGFVVRALRTNSSGLKNDAYADVADRITTRRSLTTTSARETGTGV